MSAAAFEGRVEGNYTELGSRSCRGVHAAVARTAAVAAAQTFVVLVGFAAAAAGKDVD